MSHLKNSANTIAKSKPEAVKKCFRCRSNDLVDGYVVSTLICCSCGAEMADKLPRRVYIPAVQQVDKKCHGALNEEIEMRRMTE